MKKTKDEEIKTKKEREREEKSRQGRVEEVKQQVGQTLAIDRHKQSCLSTEYLFRN